MKDGEQPLCHPYVQEQNREFEKNPIIYQGRKGKNGDAILTISRLIIENPFITSAEIGQKAGLSKSTLSYMLKKLKDKVSNDLVVSGVDCQVLKNAIEIRERHKMEEREERRVEAEQRRQEREHEREIRRIIQEEEYDARVAERKSMRTSRRPASISRQKLAEWCMFEYEMDEEIGRFVFKETVKTGRRPADLPRFYPTPWLANVSGAASGISAEDHAAREIYKSRRVLQNSIAILKNTVTVVMHLQ